MAMKVLKSPVPMPQVPETNIFNVLFHNPALVVPASHVVYIDGISGQRRTRAEHVHRVQRLATVFSTSPELGGIGVRKDERIAILSENNLEYPVLLHACLYSAVPSVLLNTHSTRDELAHSLSVSEPTRIFVSQNFLAIITSALEKASLSHPPQIILIKGSLSTRDYLDIDKLINQTERYPVVPVQVVKRNTVAYLLFSSGTGGLPKAVMISHGNVISTLFSGIASTKARMALTQAQSPGNAVADSSPNILLGVLPLYHTYGLYLFVFRLHIATNTAVLMPKWSASASLRAISKYGVTILTLVPSMIHQLVNSPSLHGPSAEAMRKSLKSVNSILSAAAFLSPELAAKAQELFRSAASFAKPGQSYGLSEATVSVLGAPMIPPEAAPMGFNLESAMTIVPGIEAILVDTDENGISRPVAKGSIGELWLRGPTVALGYWRNGPATQATFGFTLDGVDGTGWMRTGDRFFVDSKQYFYFVDRAKDTMKISGVQVSPTEIEETILVHCHDMINDVSVAGVNASLLNDPIQGASSRDEPKRRILQGSLVPRAWVVLSNKGKQLGEHESALLILSAVRDHLSKQKWLLGGVEFVDSIPKNPTGKVLRRTLQEQFERVRGPKRRASARL